jgi:hypothetical protein
MGFWSRILDLVGSGEASGRLQNKTAGQTLTGGTFREGAGIVSAAEKGAKLAHVAVIDLLEHPAYFQMGHWDRVGTIAGVCAAAIILRNRLSPAEFKVVEESLSTALSSSHPEGPDALRDCDSFVMRSASSGGAFDSKMLPMALGMWFLWNLRGEQPPESEMTTAALAGQVLFECIQEALG